MIDIVSGASAGALNAVLLADGLTAGGPSEARKRLRNFWHCVGHSSGQLPVGPGRPFGATAAFHLSTKFTSPYQFNPLGLNPLRRLLADAVDFDRLRAQSSVRLLIAATRVKDGRLRLFRENEVTLESVLASACLPMLHHAVEIDGEAYWDGGYSANPPVRQLVIDSDARDVVLIQLLPDEFGVAPRMASNISRRVQEIAFATSLHRELEALEDLREICHRSSMIQSPLGRKLRDLQFHHVVAADTVRGLARESALDSRWSLLCRLKEDGRKAASSWLEANERLTRSNSAENRSRLEDIDPRPLPDGEGLGWPRIPSTQDLQQESMHEVRPYPIFGAVKVAAVDYHRSEHGWQQQRANAVNVEKLLLETQPTMAPSAGTRVPLEQDPVLGESRPVGEIAQHSAQDVAQTENTPIQPLVAREATRECREGDRERASPVSALAQRRHGTDSPHKPSQACRPRGWAEHVLAQKPRTISRRVCTSLLGYFMCIQKSSARLLIIGLSPRGLARVPLSSQSAPDRPDRENGGLALVTANRDQAEPRPPAAGGAFRQTRQTGGLCVR